MPSAQAQALSLDRVKVGRGKPSAQAQALSLDRVKVGRGKPSAWAWALGLDLGLEIVVIIIELHIF